MRILIVDDERQITRVLRTSLQSSGYDVTVANNGLEAFDLFRSVAPDLIITDLAMPEMGGIELTRAVDRTLDDYVKRKQLGPHWSVTEKVAVCISNRPQARDLIARGARLAEGLGGELYVIHVQGPKQETPERQRTLEASLQFAANLGAQIVHLTAKNIPSATAAYVCEHRVTQAIFGRSALHGLRKYL